MSQTASVSDSTAGVSMLFVAFELGWTRWRLAFGSAMGQKAWQVTIPARNGEAIAKARKRSGLKPGADRIGLFGLAGRNRSNIEADATRLDLGTDRLLSKARGEEVDHLLRLGMFLAHVAHDGGDLTRGGHRRAKGNERALLLDHLLSKRKKGVQKSIQVWSTHATVP